MTRDAATLIETVVAVTLALLVAGILFTLTRMGTKVEGSATREAQFAVQMALLYEYLSNDLRSSFDVKETSPGHYVIRRHFDRGDGPAEVDVVYRVEKEKQRITRELPDEKPIVFDFNELMPERMEFELQVKRIEGAP